MKLNFLMLFMLDAALNATGGGTAEKEQLLSDIKSKVGEELNKRGYTSKTDVETMINEKLKDVEIEALRAYNTNKTALETQIRGMATDLQKLKDNGIGGEQREKKSLQSILDDNMPAIAKAFRSRDPRDAVKITFNRSELQESEGERAAVIMTTQNVTDFSALGAADFVDNFRVDAFVDKRRPREYIYDIADRTVVAEVPEVIIWEEEGGEQGAVAIVAEGAVKPLVSFTMVKNMSEYKKAAGKIVVTEEFAKFRKRAFQIVKQLFNDKILRDYQAILTTNLNTAATAYLGTSLDLTIVAPTDYHALAAVALQLETLNFFPDTLIINPADKSRIALAQDNTGNFITNVPVVTRDGQVQLMGLRTVVTTRIAAGTFIMGEGNTWKIEEEAVTMRMGHGITLNGAAYESDFDTNKFRIIGELYFHNYIATNNAGAFVKATFTAMKAALLKP